MFSKKYLLFFFIQNEENRPNIIPIEDIPEEVVPAVQVLFLTNDKSQLILASRLGGLQVLALGNDSVMLSQNIDTHDGNEIPLFIKFLCIMIFCF